MALIGFDHTIAWGEFQQRPTRPSGFDEDAQVNLSSGLTFGYERGSDGNVRFTHIEASIRVNASTSWVVGSARSAELLEHEQGHYDIQALGQREVYQRLSQLAESSQRDLDRHAREINSEVQAKITTKNRRYDQQTQHFLNRTQQAAWNTAIRAAKTSATGTLDSLP